jgi:Nucleotidyl transferase AbiEii toxin, Type IV TA system
MPVSDLHREVAAVALRAAARHGFALGGGNALIAHGVINRPTEDVDLFTDREHGVAAAADAVEAALRAAGYSAQRQDKAAGLAEVFEGMGDGLAEWIITTEGREMMLQMAYFDRGRQPVLMEFGPVLDLDDVLGGKVAALASRAAERDYIDVAAALARGYSVAHLTGLALTLDPGLTAEDFADAGQRLDRLGDDRFARYGLTQEDVTRLRERFAAWPRTPGSSSLLSLLWRLPELRARRGCLLPRMDADPVADVTIDSRGLRVDHGPAEYPIGGEAEDGPGGPFRREDSGVPGTGR